MASGDITKAKHILQHENWANVLLYANAMPHYDDVEPGKQNTKQPCAGDNFEYNAGKTVSKKMNLWSLMDVMEQWQNSKI